MMIRLILCIFIHYLEYLWKYLEQPIGFLIIRQCKNEESMSHIRSFLFDQYEKILSLFLNRKKQQECHLYKINLHLPMLFFLLKCIFISYYLHLLLKILHWLYEKQCYSILQRQIKPFVHIRSVALISKDK
jgi:hypothetical protein